VPALWPWRDGCLLAQAASTATGRTQRLHEGVPGLSPGSGPDPRSGAAGCCVRMASLSRAGSTAVLC